MADSTSIPTGSKSDPLFLQWWHNQQLKRKINDLEKSLEWWSGCTSFWRDKWTKVKTERNHARDEMKSLQSRFEVIAQENSTLRKAYKSMESFYTSKIDELLRIRYVGKESLDNTGMAGMALTEPCVNDDCIENKLLAIEHNNPSTVEYTSNNTSSNRPSINESVSCLDMNNWKIDELLKMISTEREEKRNLQKTLENMEMEMYKFHEKFVFGKRIDNCPRTRVYLNYTNIQDDLPAKRTADAQTQVELSLVENNSEQIKRVLEINSSQTIDQQLSQLQLEFFNRSWEIKDVLKYLILLQTRLNNKRMEGNYQARRIEQFRHEVAKLRFHIRELKSNIINMDMSNIISRWIEKSNENLL